MTNFFFKIFALTVTLSWVNLEASAASAYQTLIRGNAAFASESSENKRRWELVEGQTPIATVLCCSDSRVPPEIIFGQGLGELFIVRLAGNVVDEIALESIHFGLFTLHTPLLIVLGHQNCGAVREAISVFLKNPSMTKSALLNEIFPSVRSTESPDLAQEVWLDLAIQKNIQHSAKKILDFDPLIREKVKQGEIKLVLGEYQMKTGKVIWLPLANGIK